MILASSLFPVKGIAAFKKKNIANGKCRAVWISTSFSTATSKPSPRIALLEKARSKGHSMFPASTPMIRVTTSSPHMCPPMSPGKKTSSPSVTTPSPWRHGCPSTVPSYCWRLRGWTSPMLWCSTYLIPVQPRCRPRRTIRPGSWGIIPSGWTRTNTRYMRSQHRRERR